MIIQLKLIYYLLSLLISTFSIALVVVVYLKSEKNDILKSYLIYFFIVSGKIISWLAMSYLDVFNLSILSYPAINNFLIVFASLHFWAFPLFIHSYFSVPFCKKLNIVFMCISIFLMITGILDIQPRPHTHTFLGHLQVFGLIKVAIMIYMVVICFIYYKKIKNPILKEIGLVMGVLSLIFLPLRSINMVFCCISTKIIVIAPIFYIIWNVYAFYYAIKYYFTTSSVNDELSKKFINKYNITDREVDVIKLLLKGFRNNQIADKECISLTTVKTHIYNVYRKTNVKSRLQFFELVKMWNK